MATMPTRSICRALLVSVALAAAVGSPTVVVGGDDKAPTPAAPGSDSTPDAKVDAFARDTGALGAYWDSSDGQFVVVYPTGTQLPDLAQVASTGLAIASQQTNVTASDVATAQSRLTAMYSAGELHGGSWGVYFDPTTKVVVVDGSGSQAIVQPILDTLGAKARFQSTGVGSRLSRLADVTPFWGGAQIQGAAPGGGTDGCTSGFAVVSTGLLLKSIVTAGHCFVNGAQVTTPVATVEGSVTSRAGFPALDMEMYSGKTYAGKIYVGNTIGVVMSVGSPAGNSVPGTIYCTSGAQSAEICNRVSIANNVTQCWSDGCTNDLTSFTHGDSLIPGDSGGPFYIKDSTLAYPRGIIIGFVGSTGYAQEWSIIHSTFSVNPCSTTTSC
jgi:hypothetical protein